MKIDMHCPYQGRFSGRKVPIEQYIRVLRNQGFGGMLVTDHDFLREDAVVGRKISRR